MRKGRVYLRPQARLDIVEQALFIGESSARTAERFFDSVEKTTQALSGMPGIGSPRDFDNARLKGLRMLPVDSFAITGCLTNNGP